MVLRELLHYRLLEKIGEGGMGTVYSALDTHLDRLVAIKVLPPAKVADPERRQRFVQEAKAASALHHPNIIVVHDIASDKGEDFIVMEFIQGATLDQLLGRKGLKLSEALGYAIQIADGLARAHAAGIVHRDLKPTNIMVTEDGRVKILDFGLAKLLENPTPPPVEATVTLRGQDKPETEEGFIVGTAAYMSPEQAEGKKVDARSDIFSFGAVLYEMLTGQRAFQRDSRVATLAAVLQEEAKPATQLNESLPVEIEQILARCLRKDPQRRWQSMSDVKVVLQDLKDDSDSGKLQAAKAIVTARRKNIIAPLAAGVIILAAVVVLAWLFFSRKPAAPTEFDITRLTYETGATFGSAVSPDGMMFAYSSDRAGNGDQDIWVQQVSGEKPLRLTDDPADDLFPSFSPDGSKIVFQSSRDNGGIFIIDTLGGQARRIAGRGELPRFSPNGSWVSYVDVPASLDLSLTRMYIVPSQGGPPRAFQPEFQELNIGMGASPVWSPDGRFILFSGRRADDPQSSDWWVAPVDGGPAVRTNAMRDLALNSPWSDPNAWAGDYVYYSVGTTVEGVNLYRVALDKKTFQVSGKPERITSGAGTQWQASVARDGRVVFSNMIWSANIWSLAADPDKATAPSNPLPLSQDVRVKFNPSVSRDGTRVSFEAFGGIQARRDAITLKDSAGGRERTIPVMGRPLWVVSRVSPDGSLLAYSDYLADGYHTTLTPWDGSSSREICARCTIQGFSSDSRSAVVTRGAKGVSRIEFATGKESPLLSLSSGSVGSPSLSPDDRWLAFILNHPNGSVAVHAVPLGNGPVSEKDGIPIIESDRFLGSPQWSPDGNILYFISARNTGCGIWGLRLDPRTKAPRGEPLLLFQPRGMYRLNTPADCAAMAVTKNKFVFFMATVTGNIYMAMPRTR